MVPQELSMSKALIGREFEASVHLWWQRFASTSGILAKEKLNCPAGQSWVRG